MRLITTPSTPIWIRVLSILGALVVGGLIVYLVFNFGYYASGLAAFKEDQRRRQETPIPLTFGDPNAPAPPPDANAPGR